MELITQLRNIRSKVNNLNIDDDKAKELEDLITKSMDIIQKLRNPTHDYFEARKQIALHDLENDLGKHIKGYWEAGNKVEKITEFSRARNDVNYVIGRILATFGR